MTATGYPPGAVTCAGAPSMAEPGDDGVVACCVCSYLQRRLSVPQAPLRRRAVRRRPHRTPGIAVGTMFTFPTTPLRDEAEHLRHKYRIRRGRL